MAVLYLLWLVLAGIFFSFAYMFLRQAQSPLRTFQVRQRGTEGGKAGEPDKAMTDLALEVNNYLESINTTNRNLNRTAAISALICGLVAIVSLVIAFYQASLIG
jgi:ABC-type spermidine/putrescine transport system permease subunit I